MSLVLLKRARSTLERFAPGFDALLGEMPFAQREDAASPVVQWFKQHGPVALLIPSACGGQGASLFDAVQVQIALGARSPSLAVATTMHQFSVASLVAISRQGGPEGLLLTAIAQQRLMLASGFAEGGGAHILDASMSARATPEGVYLTGSKKPCSLGASMDLLTASYSRMTPAGEELMIAMIPAKTPGVSSTPFWANHCLAAAQSVEVRLDEVFVNQRMLFSAGLREQLGRVQIIGFISFELLISAAYLGTCLGLIEEPVLTSRGNTDQRIELASRMQLCLSALEGLALEADDDIADPDDLLARLLLVRYGIEQCLEANATLAQRLYGGRGFICSPSVSMWSDSCRGLCFHPPARSSVGSAMDRYLHHSIFNLA